MLPLSDSEQKLSNDSHCLRLRPKCGLSVCTTLLETEHNVFEFKIVRSQRQRACNCRKRGWWFHGPLRGHMIHYNIIMLHDLWVGWWYELNHWRFKCRSLRLWAVKDIQIQKMIRETGSVANSQLSLKWDLPAVSGSQQISARGPKECSSMSIR